MTEPEILTERLLLRPYTMEDAEPMHRAVFGDHAVMKFLPGNTARPLDAASKSMAYFIKHWDEHGYGAWGVVHRADDVMIGQCGLNRLPDGAVEVFYAFAARYWGQGLATEAARAAMKYGFEVVALPQIIGLAYPDNLASRHVLEKLGMGYRGTTDSYYGITFAHYTLDAAAYAAQRHEP